MTAYTPPPMEPGTEVAVYAKHYDGGDSYQTAVVERLTRTQVVMVDGRRFNLATGCRVGESHSYPIVIGLDDPRAERVRVRESVRDAMGDLVAACMDAQQAARIHTTETADALAWALRFKAAADKAVAALQPLTETEEIDR